MKKKTYNKIIYFIAILVNLPLLVINAILFIFSKVLHNFIWWLNNQTTSFYNYMYRGALFDLFKIPVINLQKDEKCEVEE